jgi:DNA topoisomerase VI subunit B
MPQSGSAESGIAGRQGKKRARGEQIQFKSPAEFFAENQNIAGFDNVRGLLKRK